MSNWTQLQCINIELRIVKYQFDTNIKSNVLFTYTFCVTMNDISMKQQAENIMFHCICIKHFMDCQPLKDLGIEEIKEAWQYLGTKMLKSLSISELMMVFISIPFTWNRSDSHGTWSIPLWKYFKTICNCIIWIRWHFQDKNKVSLILSN